VYEVALTVVACLRAGTHVDVAWAVAAEGLGPGVVPDPADAVALTPGGGRVGSLLGGALDAQLGELVAAGVRRRVVDLVVSPVDALVAGVAPGARARVLLMPAEDLPPDLWERLLRREPVTLVARLAGEDVESVELVAPSEGDAPAAAGRTEAAGDVVTTLLVPVPRIVVVGTGPIPTAVEAAAALLGWHVQTARDGATASGLVAGLAALDKVVVAAHDDDIAGPALQAALATDVGYIGAVGPRRVQQSRADWLAYRGVTDLSRVHGPAGLDIGAATPAEIAVSVLAEAVAVAAGRSIALTENPT
jgi:xanthine dehydrogenase accessory factor